MENNDCIKSGFIVIESFNLAGPLSFCDLERAQQGKVGGASMLTIDL